MAEDTHEARTGVAIDAAHACAVMRIRLSALQNASVAQPHCIASLCLFRFGQSRVTERDSARPGMAAKAPSVGDGCGQCWMAAGDRFVEMTGEAASAPVVYGISAMSGQRLPEVAAGAQLAEQAVGQRVP